MATVPRNRHPGETDRERERQMTAHREQPFRDMVGDAIRLFPAQAEEDLLDDIARVIAIVEQPRCVAQQRPFVPAQRVGDPGFVGAAHISEDG